MSSQLFTTVLLDQPRRIRFSNRSIYKVQSLDRPFELRDITSKKRGFAALAAWLWACLDETHQFESPAELSEHIQPERFEELARTLFECVEMGSKKKNGTASPPSPGSNSG